MKLAEEILNVILESTIDKKLLKAIEIDLAGSFEPEDLAKIKSFDDFWDEIDTLQAYEEEWEENKDNLKQYYKVIWKKIEAGTF